MHPIQPTIKGRGAADNPPNRFERLHVEADPDASCSPEDGQPDPPQTVYLRDTSRTILASNDSPDIPFSFSINPYRGCSHGCIYCFARPTHEYLGFSAGLDFETKIMVKADAPQLLRKELSAKSWRPAVIAISGVTDPYQPVERQLRLTRRCLEVLAEMGNPVVLVTKNHLVTRDIDLLGPMAAQKLAAVCMSITTLDNDLARVMEPRTASPRRRLEAVRKLTEAGVPVCALISPVIPGLTDHELPAILEAAAGAGAREAGWQPVRLPLGVADLFSDWLQRHYPDRREKVLNRIRSTHGGQLNHPQFSKRMDREGIFADQIGQIFDLTCRKLGLNRERFDLATDRFRRPGEQYSLFAE